MTIEEYRKLPKRNKAKDLPLNEMFAAQLSRAGIAFEREQKFHPERRWKMDFTILPNIAIELQGGNYAKQRLGHSTGTGLAKSYEKLNAATIMGYRVLQFDSVMVRDGTGLRTVQLALGIGTNKNYPKQHGR